MTSRNWVRLFFSTLIVGGITTAIVGFIVRWSQFHTYFTEFKVADILSALIWLIVMGFLFSVISQMGFFAYLTIHRFGLGIFKSVSLWNSVQIVLIIFALFDLVYLRYESFAKPGSPVFPYVGQAALILVLGFVTAWFKMKQTNQRAFIPALFFMIVATLIEWVPALRVKESTLFYPMMFTLLACNAYQLFILHTLNLRSELERQKRVIEKRATDSNRKITKKPSV